jgi:hypothetical protein
MADVAIIHAPDKKTAAARLAEAIAAAGFEVGAVEIEDPSRLAVAVDGCTSDARILVWSRPLVSHALHSGELRRIRQLRGLIEVSADGIAPPSRGDEARIVSISGWRGQPFHPGWQRIHAEVKRLCGSRKPVSEAPPPIVVAASPRPLPTAPAAPGTGARPQRRLMLGGGIAVLAVATAVGAMSGFGSGGRDERPRRELLEAPAPDAVVGAPRPAPRAAPEPPKTAVAPPPAESLAAAAASPEPPRAAPASRPAPAKLVARPELRPSPQAGPPKKYSRKNSKVMRQFCERSGRSTPQCRTFLRSIRSTEPGTT